MKSKMNKPTQPPECLICRKEVGSFYCFKHPSCYFRCPRCGSIFQHPLPSIREMIDYANQEYLDGGYKEYVQASDLKLATFRDRIRNICHRAQGKRLLDVGCACGYFIDIALQEGFDAYGIEFSAQAMAAASPQARTRIIHADVNQLSSTRRDWYDVVAAFDIVEHTLDPVDFLIDLKNMLRRGGMLVMTTPDTGHFLRPMMGRRWPMLQPFQHTFLFSRASLRLALEKAGYAEIELMPARKILTPDYLVQQIKIYNPLIARLYYFFSTVLPNGLRKMPLRVNIGEIMAFARRGG